ncbi:cell division protein DivIVA [Amycolatopsis anabasis]|uniref:cell division protein DivIVA n=1 Tax=Amycolatopsis anabasis TaxID=1840409 RepID=UPI00131A70B9|nr:cell division protein DivIVA [Amycolatopsis anabasis]
MAEADTPNPAPNTSHFATAFRGYNVEQVDERFKRLTAELKEAAQNRDQALASVSELTKALSLAQQELSEAKAGLARMATNPTGATAMTERVRTMMALADEEIAELRKNADEYSENKKSEADDYARDVRAAADERTKELDERSRELEEKYANLTSELEDKHAKLREELEAEFEALKKEHNEEHKQLLADARAEAERKAAETEAAAKEKAAGIIADAEGRLAEAEQTRTRAREFSAKVTEQLSATSAAVQEAIAHLAPSEEDQPVAEAKAGEPAEKTEEPKNAKEKVPSP